MKKLYLFTTFLFLSLSFFAQKIQVLDKSDKTPIKGAIISDNFSSIITDNKGLANLQNIKTNKIIVSADFYESILVNLTKSKSDTITVFLEKNLLEIEPIRIAANKWEQNTEEIAVPVVPINIKNIDFTNPQTSADLLGTNNQIFIQKSQLGGGSPMIRGFAANRILIVIDGIRMNNAIYRSGNLQNIISIDPNSIEQAEVVLGPGSVIYGSDALGGVIDFHSKKTIFSNSNKLLTKFSSFLRYSSANNEYSSHIDFNIGNNKIASYTSLSYSKFDDLKMGTIGHPEYTRPEYIETTNGLDIVLPNTNPNIQKFTAYSAYNLLQKFSYKPSDKLLINYNIYLSTTSNIPRYDRLIQYSHGSLKYAQWYYGPQKWIMNKLSFIFFNKTNLWDNLKLNLAYQDYTESRHDRKAGKTELRERTEHLNIYNLNIDAFKEISSNTSLFYGLEINHNLVHSIGILSNIQTEQTTPYPSRYPDGSTYSNADIYIQAKTELTKKLFLNAGIRFSQVIIIATLDTTFYKFSYPQIIQKPFSPTASFGLTYSTKNKWIFALNIANAFRSPNIDDLAKVFDSEPGNVIIPNPNLKSEYIYDADFSICKQTNKYLIKLNSFYSYLDNAMVRSDFSLNRQDSMLYDGTMSKIQALTNSDYAIIYGISTNLALSITNNIIYKTSIIFMHGYDSNGNALRHVAPNRASTHILYYGKKTKADLYAIYNQQITYENLAPSEQNKPYLYSTDANGNPYCPQWWTLNFKFQYRLSQNTRINFGIENILDHRYRPYSSGIVAPGRNFIISLRLNI